MTRTDKSLIGFFNTGKGFFSRHPEFRVIRRNVGRFDLTPYRLVELNANNEFEQADNRSPHIAGVPTDAGASNLVAQKSALAVVKGPARVHAYSSIEPRLPILAAPGGRISNGNYIGSGTNVAIEAATAGLSADITDADASAETITVDSTSASDTGYMLIIGVDASGVLIKEYIKMQGTTAVAGSVVFTTLYGAVLLSSNDIGGTFTAAVGTITITNTTSATTLITFSATDKSKGIQEITQADTKAKDRRVRITASALTNGPILALVGYGYDGSEVFEKVTIAATNDVVVKESSARFNNVEFMAIGEFATTTIALAQLRPEELRVGLSNAKEDITVTNTTQLAETIGFKSDSALDVGVIRLFAVDASNNVTIEDITLTGTTLSESTASDLTEIFGIYYVSGVVAGTITAYDGNDDTTVLIAADMGTYLSGGILTKDGTVAPAELDARASKVKITNSNASAADELIIYGRDIDGTLQNEFVTLSSGVVTSANKYLTIIAIANLSAETTEDFILEATEIPTEDRIIGHAVNKADSQGDIVEVSLK